MYCEYKRFFVLVSGFEVRVVVIEFSKFGYFQVQLFKIQIYVYVFQWEKWYVFCYIVDLFYYWW